MAATAFIGTSGWIYKHWASGVFYPPGMPTAAWLEFYAERFNAVEVNNTFYNLPGPEVFAQWRARTPERFRFALKVSRFITHMKKLIDPQEHVARFLSHAAALGPKLGILLFQLPPSWKFNGSRLEDLLAYVQGQRFVPGIRVALEIRHCSWQCEECCKILRKYGAALAFSDWPGCTVTGPVTTPFVFVRRHGPGDLYASDYPPAALGAESSRIRAWLAEGRDVYLFYNNDVHGFALRDAQEVRRQLTD